MCATSAARLIASGKSLARGTRMGTQILAGLLFIKHNARRCSSASSEKHVIASTSNLTVHGLKLLLVTVHRIEVSRGRLRAQVPGGSFSHAGNRSSQLSRPK